MSVDTPSPTIGGGIPLRELRPAECCSPVTSANITRGQADALSDLFKALADPGRVRIVNLLANAESPICVCEFTEALGLSQGTVSFHLKKLLFAGLIDRQQRGTWAYYSLNRDALSRLSTVFELEGATT